MKTLVVYVTHQNSPSLDFFLKHGVFSSPNVDFLIILNDPYLTLSHKLPQNVKVINRENVGWDFGGWSAGIYSTKLDDYQYFIFLNSTVIGPFLPVWSSGIHWTDIFTDMIKDDVKLAGTTIGIWNDQSHVQSMTFVTDRVGLDLLIREGIFERVPIQRSKDDLIQNKEIRMSTIILDAGYNIACLLSAYEDMDFRTHRQNLRNSNPFCVKCYYGIDYHPYETIFRKVVPGDQYGPLYMQFEKN